MVIVDFLNPGVFYPLDTEDAVLGRATATFINPNKAGEAMLVTLLLAIPVLRPRYRALLLLLVGAGVVLTFGRASILCWMLLWLFPLLRKAVPKYTLAVPLVALGVLPLLLDSFESYLEGREDLSDGLGNIPGPTVVLSGSSFGRRQCAGKSAGLGNRPGPAEPNFRRRCRRNVCVVAEVQYTQPACHARCRVRCLWDSVMGVVRCDPVKRPLLPRQESSAGDDCRVRLPVVV